MKSEVNSLATASSVLTIDLTKVERNIRRIRHHIGPRSEVMYVAKANGYGHGLIIPTLFMERQCDVHYFSVSLLCEALELRVAGLKGMLLVMGEVPYSGIADLVKNDITATLYNVEYAKALSAEAVKQGKTVNVHIKIDTGLRRLGVRVGQQLADLMTEVSRLSNLNVEGAFTHLANGYDLDKTWTHRQTAEYNAALTQLEEAGYCLKIRHMANTAGTVASPETYFDLVRVAALVFGYDISPGIENRLHLEPSITWTSRIMHILNVNPGESISYYNCYVAPKHMKVAIASFGMGDGYVRTLVSADPNSNMYVLVHGKRARIIDIAFDQTFLDVTEIDEIKLDDEITVIGSDGEEEITTMQLAERGHTSNGHICCSFSNRPYRHYIYDGKPYCLPVE